LVVLGAEALVTSKIYQSNSIIAGIPAKVIKENINWCRERI
jgi:serine acetyltransferase